VRGQEVSVHHAAVASDGASRVAIASEVADRRAAAWVVWADEPTADPSAPTGQAVLYVVGRRDGRALIEVVRVPAGQGPEVDRSLALKVHELLGTRDGAAYALGNREPPVAGTVVAQPQRVRLWLEVGGQASLEGSAGAAADTFVAIGPSLVTETLVFAAPIELALGLPRSSADEGHEVSWTELGVAGWLKLAARPSRALLVGGGIGGKIVFSDAQGTAPSGARGSTTHRLPALLVSADGELALSGSTGARVSVGLEQRLTRQSFFVEGHKAGDTGRSVLFARLSLVWHPE